ncbi:MAG TPA: hypothetical protein VJX74_02580 [Blastocatellia bacterium]|nr:hypothetical protein [Blastocatellia bacterium]
MRATSGLENNRIMQASVDILSAAATEDFERDFMGEGEVIVRREGHSRAQHIFMAQGRTIARLRWRGLRRAVYEAEAFSFDIKVSALDKRIAIIAEDGSESFLVERSRANPHKAGLRVEMAEGDNFRLIRARESSLRSEDSFAINKQFYASTLMIFRFDTERRTQTTARIEVRPVMKWESRFAHRLFALVVCRIILERRHSGSQPRRVKEKPRHFASSDRVRNRKKIK